MPKTSRYSLLLLAALLPGCGSNPLAPPPTTGSIAASWASPATASAGYVRVSLIDTSVSGTSCYAPPVNPTSGVLQSQSSQSLSSSITFDNLAPRSSYLVVAVGVSNAGLPVAVGCVDYVSVSAGQTTPVSLNMIEYVPALAGTYQVPQQLNLGLPSGIQSALLGLDMACSLSGGSGCNTYNQVTLMLTDLNVVAQWTLFDQGNGTFAGTVTWLSVQGHDVSTLDVADGTFVATVSEGSVVTFNDFSMNIQYGNLVLFLVQNVAGENLAAMGGAGTAFAQALSAQYASPMTVSGTGNIWEQPDGTVYEIAGTLDAQLTLNGASQNITMNYGAMKQ